MNTNDIASFVSDGFELAKKGGAADIYVASDNYFRLGQLPLKSHYAFGWIIYYALHQAPSGDIRARKNMLATYLKLQLERPHKLHSMILTEAIRLYKDSRDSAFGRRKEDVEDFAIDKFVELWDLKNLREGDWKRKDLDGKIMSSTAEKLITVLTDRLEEIHKPAPEEVVAVVDKAIGLYPDSFTLYAQRATMEVLAGRKDSAMALLRKAVLLAPGKFFLWSKLASLVDTSTDMRLHVALLYKAKKAPGPEQFKGRISLSLANALAGADCHAEALWELENVERQYNSNGWHMPALYHKLKKTIPGGTASRNPEEIYLKVAHLADEYIYSAIQPVKATKTYHKNPDTARANHTVKQSVAWRATDEHGTNYWFYPHRHGIDSALQLGTPLYLRIFNGKVVKAELAPSAQ